MTPRQRRLKRIAMIHEYLRQTIQGFWYDSPFMQSQEIEKLRYLVRLAKQAPMNGKKGKQ